ncbi:MAG: lytic transglycosylase domain-containing protein, partial [Proteobacteria bacterium]|nr:lytic transglycosylase domain-containing protein [Pseudomonadota bacterium]
MRALAMIGTLLLLSALPAAGAQGGAGITQMLSLPIPASVALCGEPVPLDREDVVERVDLELVVTLGNQISTTLWFKRIPRYFPFIEQAIREKGLPEDLKYVALVESNLRADAISSAGATGPWQFMAGTGSACGLERSSWRDERRDWEQATRAALDHLAELREYFGSWPAALAAYNAGKSRVAQAMEAQGQVDFYGLRLPRETERYVFRVIAAKLLVENPAAYGIELEGARLYEPEEVAEATVEVQRRQVPVAAVAGAAGVSYRRFLELNPSLVSRELPRGTHRVVVPAGAEEGVGRGLALWERENPEPKTVYYE